MLAKSSPPPSWYKVNVDAAVRSKEDRAGIGVLVCNSEGEVMATSICKVIFSEDIEFVEAIVVHKGIQLVMDIGLAPTIIVSDSPNIVVNHLLVTKYTVDVKWGGLISDIQKVFIFF